MYGRHYPWPRRTRRHGHGSWPEDYALHVAIYANGTADEPLAEQTIAALEVEWGTHAVIHRQLTLSLPNITPWSAENPQRYQVVIRLLDGAGAVYECTALWTGFRRIEINKRAVLINGKPVLFRGVNRHDHNDQTGKTRVASADPS